jgi:hypothetical protein
LVFCVFVSGTKHAVLWPPFLAGPVFSIFLFIVSAAFGFCFVAKNYHQTMLCPKIKKKKKKKKSTKIIISKL